MALHESVNSWLESRKWKAAKQRSIHLCVISLYIQESLRERERLLIDSRRKNNFDPAGKTSKMFYFYFFFCFLPCLFRVKKKREDVIILPHLFINIQPECHPHRVVGGNTDELLLDGCGKGGGGVSLGRASGWWWCCSVHISHHHSSGRLL